MDINDQWWVNNNGVSEIAIIFEIWVKSDSILSSSWSI